MLKSLFSYIYVYMLYYLIIAFQAFCIFHVYKSRNEYYWYFVIFFVPVIGATIYLFTQILNKKNITNTGNQIINLINPGKKIRDLEKKLHFSDTFQNKVDLADAYRDKNEFTKAIHLYEKALDGNFQEESHTINKVIKCYFKTKNYNKVVEYGSKINIAKSFRDSICIYAISLEKCDDIENAETQLKQVNKRYSNYPERLELARFFLRQAKQKEAKQILDEIILEINNMIEANKKKYRFIYSESKSLLKEI